MPPHRRLLPLYTADLPAVQEIVSGLRRVIDEFPDRLLIGEIYLPFERLVAYYGRDLDGVHLPFNFALLHAHWDAGTIAALIDAYEAALPAGGWPNWVLGNHDRARIASRVGDATGAHRRHAAADITRNADPLLRRRDRNARRFRSRRDRVRDPFEKRVPGIGVGRDGARTPMQWDAGDFAGFSTVEPWLPISDNFASENVETERGDLSSILDLYRRLIAARRQRPALSAGSYRRIPAEPDLLFYLRQDGQESILVALNFSSRTISLPLLPAVAIGRVLVSSFGDREGEPVSDRIVLHADEGLVIEGTMSW